MPRDLRSFKQAGDGAIDVAGEGLVAVHVIMRIPIVVGAGVDELDEAHAALDEAAGDEALPAEAFGAAALEAVKVEGGVGFFGEIEDVGHGLLHAEGGFEGLDACGEGGIGGAGLLVDAVELVEEAELEFLHLAGLAAAV